MLHKTSTLLQEPTKSTGHDHGLPKTGLVKSVLSSIVCFVIYFFFCVVFASVVFIFFPLGAPTLPCVGGPGVDAFGTM